MKKLSLIALLIGIGILGFAQKVNYVDTEYILSKIPQYQEAEKRLSETVKSWEADIAAKKDSINKMELKLESQKILYTDNQIKEKEKEIQDAKDKLQDVKLKKFGTNGELVRMRQSLVRPVQDQVWNAINKIAKQKSIGIVLDKGSDLIMIYSDPKLDISDLVIKEINGANAKTKTTKPKRSK